jgi:hypothetical protein
VPENWVWILLAAALIFLGFAMLVDDEPPIQLPVQVPDRLVQRGETIAQKSEEVVAGLRESVQLLQEEARAVNASNRAVQFMALFVSGAAVLFSVVVVLIYRLIRRLLQLYPAWPPAESDRPVESLRPRAH